MMKIRRTNGSSDVKLLECINPKRQKYLLRWDVEADKDGSASYMECEITHQPNMDEVRTIITEWYNKLVEERIISGWKWHDLNVWLSKENQLNFKAAYDLAVQTKGATLPVRFKLGTNDRPTYHTFTEMKEFTDFYTEMVNYVMQCLSYGWDMKDKLDDNLKAYQIS